MAINTLYPAVAINAFLWSEIEAAGILSRTNYNNLVPIIPVEDVPDFLTILDAQPGLNRPPYIIYTWSRIDNGQFWMVKTHEIAYSIRSTDGLKIRQLTNLFEDLFEDHDQAGIRLNAFLHGTGDTPARGKESHRIYHFKSISISTLGAPMPKDDESGTNESIITIRAQYSGG